MKNTVNTLLAELAATAKHHCRPNPAVACLLVSPDNQILATGSTQPVGQAHAEVIALREAASKGLSVRGATAYVTFEPCSHYGRTSPCCNALIEAGVAKVVVAILDPNPLVSGQGVQRLRDAGIEVEVLALDSAEAIASRELNIGFFSRMMYQTPWVRMKLAASLDGVTALGNGVSQWITSGAARADGHEWRTRACAILTGVGTILADNPRLDARLATQPRQPHIVIVDSELKTPPNAAIFTKSRLVLIYAATKNEEKQKALEEAGAQIIYLPNNAGKVDLSAMIQDLARREFNELHVEAGAKLNGALLQLGLVDEVLLYMAPKFLGEGRGLASNMFANGALLTLEGAIALKFKSIEMVGEDIRIVAGIVDK